MRSDDALSQSGYACVDRKDSMRMNVRLVFAACTMLLALGCSESTQPPRQQDRTKDEYAVWASLVDTLLTCGHDSVIYLFDSTTVRGDPKNLVTTPRQDMIEDFQSRNQVSFTVGNPSLICPSCTLVSAQSSRTPFLQISRVGFSADGNQALCYFGLSLAPGEGWGAFVHFQRVHARWVEQARYIAWMS